MSHYKSGTSFATDLTNRNGEAKIIRNDEAINLPANARVLYVGDYNITTSGEASYQTILSNTAPNGIHQGQGIDPLNPTNNPNINWATSTTATNILVMLRKKATNLRYRDDLQVMTTNVYYGAAGRVGDMFPAPTTRLATTARRLTTAAWIPAPTPR